MDLSLDFSFFIDLLMMVKRNQLGLLGLNLTKLCHIEPSSNDSITRRFMEVVDKTLLQNSFDVRVSAVIKNGGKNYK